MTPMRHCEERQRRSNPSFFLALDCFVHDRNDTGSLICLLVQSQGEKFFAFSFGRNSNRAA
jgi:hypothetical protein